ncbi:MAG: translation initiation factor IF-2 [Bacteroidia bacterium]
MSETTGTKRLSKVAKDLGVGTATLAEHLIKKGFKVDINPNAKITDEMFAILEADFQTDAKIASEAKQLGKEKQKPKTIITDPVKPKKPVVEEVEEEPAILIKTELVNTIPPVVETTTVKQEPKPVVKVEPVEEIKVEKIEEKIQPAVETEVIPEEKKPNQLKVVGKIDLEATKKGAKKSKKITEKPTTMVEPTLTEKTEEKPETIVEPEKTEHKEEEIKETTEEKIVEVPDIIQVTEPKYEKLEGLKVMGKIELPVEPVFKKPVASSDSSATKKKRKRKTIGSDQTQKVDINKTIGENRPKDKNKEFKKDFGNNNRFNKGKGKPATDEKAEITDKEIQDKLKETLARLSPGSKKPNIGDIRSRLRKEKRDAHAAERDEAMMEEELQQKVLKVTEFVTANDLAKMMDVNIAQIISACMSLGMMVSINQRLDAETITIVAEEFGYQVSFVTADQTEEIEEEKDAPENLVPRPPIVTVMGHVDHGKTSLLDYIRSANVVAGEAGGITQHIGAYEVTLESGKKITFLDTPGHEAFTAMRARGAKLTDIVIIVIAADDSVMPQTKEAISHAQAAGVPIVFAINKIDREGANPDKIREQLAAMNILVEEWGGKYQCQEISAKKGIGINELLDKVLLEAEILDLKANPNRKAVGSVIEATLDKGRGIVTTLMVQTGTMHIGDPILAGVNSGKVRAMFDERGKKIDAAGPSTPVVILGFDGAPQAGDKFIVTESETEARNIANKRQQLLREQGLRTQKHITLDEIGRRLAIGNFKELKVIVKGDVDGSIEALSDSLIKLSTDEVQVSVIYKAVGQISESDVMLASASDAIIIGFNVRPSAQARKLAETESIDIRLYSIIYKAIEEIKAAIEGMLAPEFEEKIVGNADVREVFKISKVGAVAGCMVTDGKISRNSKVRLIRDGVVVYTGELSSLKRFKDDVKEVASGYDCGLTIANFNDIKVGDQVEAYEEVQVKRSLK